VRLLKSQPSGWFFYANQGAFTALHSCVEQEDLPTLMPIKGVLMLWLIRVPVEFTFFTLQALCLLPCSPSAGRLAR
jgi:hypothetical protein